MGGFTSADRLLVGDLLSLADGGTAAITALTILDAAPGETFTTYNLDVAEFDTYFVGDAGVWVHNNGARICDSLYSLYRHQTKKLGKTPDEAFAVVERELSRRITDGITTGGASASSRFKHLGDALDEAVRLARQDAGKPVPSGPIWSPGPKKVGAPATNLWERHWLKHGGEFPDLPGPVAYVDRALDVAGYGSSSGTRCVVEGTDHAGRVIRLVWDNNNGLIDYVVATLDQAGAVDSVSTFHRLDAVTIQQNYGEKPIGLPGATIFERYLEYRRLEINGSYK